MDFASYERRRKKNRSRSISLFFSCMIGTVIAVLACLRFYSDHGIPGLPKKTVVTMKEYHALKSGMSYADAVEIIGSHGTEDFSMDLGSRSSRVMTWKNSEESVLVVTFSDGRIDSKIQVGLP